MITLSGFNYTNIYYDLSNEQFKRVQRVTHISQSESKYDFLVGADKEACFAAAKLIIKYVFNLILCSEALPYKRNLPVVLRELKLVVK